MLRQPRYTARFLPLTFTLLLLSALLLGLLAPQIGFGQAEDRGSVGEDGVVATAFGPMLFVLRMPAGEWPANLPPTVVLHTSLDQAGYTDFLATGSAADIVVLQATGAAATVLDEATSGAAYYLVDATADNASALAEQAGDVLYTAGDLLLARTSRDQELAFVEQLAGNGIPVNFLSAEALVPPSVDGLLVETASATAVRDPIVDSLMPRLTEADLRVLVDRLSGQQPVVVGGVAVTLNTRYTFAARIRDAERYVYEYYQALGLPVRYASWTYGSYSGRNVIAEVRGRVSPEKILLVGGHLDSISQTPYTLAPGADDNATGTAATMLIARLLKSYQPDVTVRFVHFTAEEQGHWGSKVYAAQMRARGEQVIGYIDLDMIGWDGNRDRVVEIHTASGPKSNAFGTAFLERNTRYALGLTFERKTTTASRFSDHSSFWDQDYAAFLIIENFFDDSLPRDRNPWYHNTGDLPSRVDYNYVARIGRLSLATVYELGGYRPAGGPTPTPTATPRPTATPTPDPGSCTNLLVNGDFETAGGWSFGSTPYPARYVTSPVYSGLRAAGLGIPSGIANRVAHSSAYQRVTIPADAPAPVVLRFARYMGGAADGVDYREALLLNSSLGYLASLERSYATGDNRWVVRTFDLTAYRGRTVYVYFNVYNNGTGSQMWNTVDRVSLGSCTGLSAALEEDGRPAPSPYADPLLSGWQVFLPQIRP
jgi:hypothetical protein